MNRAAQVPALLCSLATAVATVVAGLLAVPSACLAGGAAERSAGRPLLIGADRTLGGGMVMRMGMVVPQTGPQPDWTGSAAPGIGRDWHDWHDDQPRQPVGLGLRLSTRPPLDGLRRGLQLRLEVSGATTLSVKPRRSKLLLELHSQW
jgi:hypothetical protein